MQKSKLFIRIKVFSFYKLFLLFLFIVGVMFLFYPKNINKEILSLNSNNIDLSVKYLEFYARLSKNPIYWYLLSEEYLRLGKFQMALDSLSHLGNTFKTLKLKYKILKGLYFAKKGVKIKDIKNIQFLLYKKARNINDLNWLLKESLKFDNYSLYVKILQEIYLKTKKVQIAKKLIDIYIQEGKFVKALNVIDKVLPKLKNKKEYLKLAIKVSLWAKRYDLTKKYVLMSLPYVKEDLSFQKYLIKTALAIDNPKLAKKIVEVILKVNK